MSREAMTLALDALENHTAIKHPQQRHYRDRAIDALRAALDAPEPDYERGFIDGMQEQMKRSVDQAVRAMSAPVWIQSTHLEWARREPSMCRLEPTQRLPDFVPLYPAPREWQGLTDEELFRLWVRTPAETENKFAFVKAVMAKLKEKNGG